MKPIKKKKKSNSIAPVFEKKAFRQIYDGYEIYLVKYKLIK